MTVEPRDRRLLDRLAALIDRLDGVPADVVTAAECAFRAVSGEAGRLDRLAG